jgi:hypothetical protein
MSPLNGPGAAAVLRAQRENLPRWLAQHEGGSVLAPGGADYFLASRTVFYPGAGEDGQAFGLFCRTHSAHCVIHADLMHSPRQIAELLSPGHRHRPKGYRPVTLEELTSEETTRLLQLDPGHPYQREPELQGALWAILEREPGLKDAHGPERLAFLHIQAEAVWLFWNLWVRGDAAPPYAVILQDHGFGGNWSQFGGRDSPLWQTAAASSNLPTWLLVGEDTDPWPGYERRSSPAAPSGMHRNHRSLFRRAPGSNTSVFRERPYSISTSP